MALAEASRTQYNSTTENKNSKTVKRVTSATVGLLEEMRFQMFLENSQ